MRTGHPPVKDGTSLPASRRQMAGRASMTVKSSRCVIVRAPR
jgi:hypothetical protein